MKKKPMLTRFKNRLILKLYVILCKYFCDTVLFWLDQEHEYGFTPEGGTLKNQIKRIYKQINDNNHIRELYALNIKNNVQHCTGLFDKHCLDQEFFTLREITGKHDRKYNMIICKHKNAKTIFNLSIAS
jgi:hypothetical protein